MRTWAEIAIFGGLATAIHVALWAGLPEGGAPEAAGSEGQAILSLRGSAGAIEAMVAAWDAPPRAVPAPMADLPAMETGDADVAPRVPPKDPGLRRTPARTALAAQGRPVAPPAPAEVAPVPLPRPEAVVAALPAVEAPESGPPARTNTADGAPAARPPNAPKPPPLPEAGPLAEAPPAPATRPQARPEQTARGSGGGSSQGVRAETTGATLSANARRSLVASWGAEIRARIEARKVHPRGVRAAGRPVIRITVTKGGTLESAVVVQSSRIAALDEAALGAVRRAGRFPAAPRELDLQRVSFDLPIAFTR